MSAETMRKENQVNNENDVENANDVQSKKDRVAFVFYYFETQQDETIEGMKNVKMHISTLRKQICETGAEIQKMSTRCHWYDVREFVFRHDSINSFIEFFWEYK